MTNRRRIVGPLPVPAKSLGSGAAVAGTTHGGTLRRGAGALDALDARDQIRGGVEGVVRARLQHAPAGAFAPSLPFSLTEHKFSTKAAVCMAAGRFTAKLTRNHLRSGAARRSTTRRALARSGRWAVRRCERGTFPAAGSRQFKLELVNKSSDFED
jgi:hypothetical protein